MDFIITKYHYWFYVSLMMVGLYAMIVKKNFVKKLVGLNIFQTSIILFFVSSATKIHATIPIIQETEGIINPAHYMNPLPHVLMLTAIVVMVSSFGVALALLIMIYKKYKTLDEDEILDIMRNKQ